MPGCLARTARTERLVHLAFSAFPAFRASGETLVPLASLDPQEALAQLARQESLGRQEPQASLDPQGRWECRGLWATPGSREHREILAGRGLAVCRVLRAPQARWAPLGLRASTARTARKEPLGLAVRTEFLGCAATRVPGDRWARQGTMAAGAFGQRRQGWS